MSSRLHCLWHLGPITDGGSQAIGSVGVTSLFAEINTFGALPTRTDQGDAPWERAHTRPTASEPRGLAAPVAS